MYYLLAGIGIIVFVLAAYLRQRKKARARQIAMQTDDMNGYDPSTDNFYCMMLQDGTSRFGYIEPTEDPLETAAQSDTDKRTTSSDD